MLSSLGSFRKAGSTGMYILRPWMPTAKTPQLRPPIVAVLPVAQRREPPARAGQMSPSILEIPPRLKGGGWGKDHGRKWTAVGTLSHPLESR